MTNEFDKIIDTMKDLLNRYIIKEPSNFQIEKFWKLLEKIRSSSSNKIRLSAVRELLNYSEKSNLAREGALTFIGDSSEKINREVLKNPQKIAHREYFHKLREHFDNLFSFWSQGKMAKLLVIMFQSDKEEFKDWVLELFEKKSFFGRNGREEKKSFLIKFLITSQEEEHIDLLGELVMNRAYKLSDSQRKRIIQYREKVKVKKLSSKRLETLSPSGLEKTYSRKNQKKNLEGKSQGGYEKRNETENLKYISEENQRKLEKLEAKISQLIPRQFDGYEITSPIGQGGMGAVLSARQKSLDREVALKLLMNAYDPDIVERFLMEAKTIASLNHPNIIQVYGYGVIEDFPYFVMEKVDGISLAEFIQKSKNLKISQILGIMEQIIQALAFAHNKGIYHRDLKPSNIMVTRFGQVKILDFGLAKVASGSNNLTQTGAVMGTPSYMAPEQARGETIDHRADIYSLGVVLFEMLTGQVPFQGDTPMIVLYNHISTTPPLPREINPQIPEWLERVVLKSLRKDPDKRYYSMEQFIKDLKLKSEESKVTGNEKILTPSQKNKVKEKLKKSTHIDFADLYQEKEEELENKPTTVIKKKTFLYQLMEKLNETSPSTLLSLIKNNLFETNLPHEEKDEIIRSILDLKETNLILVLAGLLDNDKNLSDSQRKMIEDALFRREI